jgi:hypothetical protein
MEHQGNSRASSADRDVAVRSASRHRLRTSFAVPSRALWHRRHRRHSRHLRHLEEGRQGTGKRQPDCGFALLYPAQSIRWPIRRHVRVVSSCCPEYLNAQRRGRRRRCPHCLSQRACCSHVYRELPSIGLCPHDVCRIVRLAHGVGSPDNTA